MKLEQSFEVDAPLERVWEALVDVERVAPCLPGAAVTGRNDDGSYNGTFSVKIGPTSASYAGKLHMEQIDEGTHSATMQASGTDKRGQGGAKATIVSTLASAGDGATRVDVSTDYHITGRLARFGRGGMIEEISNRLLREFARNLQASLAGGGPGTVTATAGAGASNRSEASPAPGAEAPASREAAGAPAAGEEAAYGEAAAPPLGEPEPPTRPAAEPPAEAAPLAPAPAAAEAPATAEEEAAAYGEAAAPPLGEPEPLGSGEAAAPLGEPEPPGSGATTQPPPEPAWSAPPPPPPESQPMQGLSLVGGALWSQVKRNPAPAAGLLVALLVLLRLVSRRG